MSKHLMSPLALVLGLAFAPLAAYEPQAPKPSATPSPMEKGKPHRPRMEGRAKRGDRMAKYLKLSDDQRAKIKAIHERHKDAMKGKREATQQTRRTFFEAAKDPNTSVEQLRNLHRAMSDQNFDMLLARRALRLETRQVLTPEQREKAAEAHGLMEARMHHRRERMGKRMADH